MGNFLLLRSFLRGNVIPTTNEFFFYLQDKMKALEDDDGYQSHMFVFLSDLWLDQPKVDCPYPLCIGSNRSSCWKIIFNWRWNVLINLSCFIFRSFVSFIRWCQNSKCCWVGTRKCHLQLSSSVEIFYHNLMEASTRLSWRMDSKN